MKKLIILVNFIIYFIWQTQAQWTIETVPNPKSQNNTFVSNPDKILTSDQVFELNGMIQTIEDSAKAQIAVVMLQSIGSAVPKEFATSLFNKWGVGFAGKDNGLLILFVMDQRRIEFETGYGIEQILTDAACYQIQQDYMVPRFKEGNYGQGILDGVKVVVAVFMGDSNLINSEAPGTTPATNDTYSDSNYNNTTQVNSDFKDGLGLYIKATLLAMFIYLILYIITIFQKDCFDRYKTLRIFKLYIWFILFPIPFIALYYFTKKQMEIWRNTPRISPKTGILMRKLSETEDNQYLQGGQITEENLKSIDYDVWISDEPGDILVISYKRWFSAYSSCPKCSFKTYFKEYDRVITSPTYSSSGTGERKFVCKHCGHSKTERYTIPRKTKSSSSSYRSSSYGGSSSSGGGSFGGGRSGGGGSGSSW